MYNTCSGHDTAAAELWNTTKHLFQVDPLRPIPLLTLWISEVLTQA